MAFSLAFASCSDDDPAPRSEADIYGAWEDNSGDYFYFRYPNICYKLAPGADGSAALDYDAYYYEPGYNFLLYMNIEGQPDIYGVTELSQSQMKWVWADNLLDEKYKEMSKSEILGYIIKEAQEGFKLDYSRTSSFTRMETAEFKTLLEKYGYSYLIDEL